MRIAFVQDFWQEYQGIMIMSAMLKKAGHCVDVFIKGEDNFENKILEFNPKILGFSVNTGGHVWCLEQALKFKTLAPEIITVLGGPHPTIKTDIINENGVDVIVIGEGEETLLELVESIDKGKDFNKLKGAFVKNGSTYKNPLRKPIQNLDLLPMPDWELYYKYPFFRNKKQKAFMGSRGCPYNCSFCSNHVYRQLSDETKGRYVRQKSPSKLIDEIIKVKDDLNLETITFDDEIFVLNHKWLDEFLALYKEKVKLPFFIGVRADLVNKSLIEKLKNAGCYGISFGVESGDETLRNLALCKQITDKQIRDAAEIIKSYDLILRTTSMFGLPGETLGMAMKTVFLNKAIKVDHPFAYIYEPLPGTKLYEYCKKNKLLSENFSFDSLKGAQFNFSVLEQKNIPALLKVHGLYYAMIKLPALNFIWILLLKMPLSFIHKAIFKLSLAHNYSKYKRISFVKTLCLAYKAYKNQR